MTTKITTPGGLQVPQGCLDAEMRRLAQHHTEQAVVTLAALMTNGATEDVRAAARASLECRMIDVAQFKIASGEALDDDA